MKKNKKLIVISALFLSLGLTSCGDNFPSFVNYEEGDNGEIHTEYKPYDNGKRIEEIILSESKVSLDFTSVKDYQISASFEPSDAANPTLYYTSNTPEIASVDENGKVSILNNGEASISVSSDTGVSSELKIDVYTPVTAISILPHMEGDKGQVLDISAEKQFTCSFEPENTTQRDVEWFVTDSNGDPTNLVSISDTGLLSVDVAPGTRDLSFLVSAVSKANSEIKANEKVTIYDERVYPTHLSIFKEDVDVTDCTEEVVLRDTLQLSADVTFPEEEGPKTGKVTWTSSDPTSVSVDENGLVTALRADSANPISAVVTATISGFDDNHVFGTLSASTTIQTKKIAVESISLDETDIILNKRDSATLTATVLPDNASYKDYVFSVESGNEYVSVDAQSGKVTANYQSGTNHAVIRCTSSDDNTVYAECNVTVTNLVQSVEISSPVRYLHEGEETTLTYVSDPVDADAFSVTWESSDPTIATIDQDGHVVANNEAKYGEVTFTLTVDGTDISDTLPFEVIAPLPEFAWGIAGTQSGWTLDESAPMVKQSVPDSGALYTYKVDYTFEANDEWKITNTDNEWVNNGENVGFNSEKSTPGAFSTNEVGNIVAAGEGTYTITLNVYEGAQKDEGGNYYNGMEIYVVDRTQYAYVKNGGEPVNLTVGPDLDGKPQLEALGIEMAANDTIYFVNIAPEEPQIITSLKIGGDDAHGFTIVDGVLTSSKENEFNFYVKLSYGNDVVYITEKVIEPIYAYVIGEDEPVTLTEGQDDQGNPQLEALDIAMSEGGTILFENIAPKTPEPLSALKIGGDDAHGFTINKGVLTADHDGTFSFYVKLSYGNDVVYIAETSGPEPEFAWSIAGTHTDPTWVLDANAKMSKVEPAQGTALYTYQVSGVELEKDVKFKVINTKPEWVNNVEGVVGLDLNLSTPGAVSIDNGDIKVETSSTFTITLNIYENAELDDINFVSGMQVIVIDENAPVYEDYALHALVSPSEEWEDIKMSLKQGSETEYMVQHEFSAGDEFVVHLTGNNWMNFSDVKGGCKSLVESNGDNIVFLEDGVYTIYAETGDDYGIWISKASITFNMNEPAVEVGKNLEIPVTCSDCLELEFTSDDATKVSIVSEADDKVVVKGEAVGDAVITATASNGVTSTIKVSVSDEPVTNTYTVRFTCKFSTYAQGDLYFCSNVTSWEANSTSTMTWSTNDIWYIDITCEEGTKIEFKLYTTYQSHGWEQWDGNRTHTFTKNETISVSYVW